MRWGFGCSLAAAAAPVVAVVVFAAATVFAAAIIVGAAFVLLLLWVWLQQEGVFLMLQYRYCDAVACFR